VNLGGTAKVTHLVKIDPSNGAVTDVGASVTALDALAFLPAVPEPGVGGVVMGMVGVGLARRRGRGVRGS
jgi:hypothetical protein